MGRRKRVRSIYPIGLGYIAAVVSRKHEVKIFDPNVYDLSEGIKKLKLEIKTFNPEIVGISIKYIDTTQKRDPFIFYNTIQPTISSIKSLNPSIKIVAGGPGFSMFAEEIMLDIPEIDFGIFLEGEVSFSELLENINGPEKVKGIFFRENSRVHFAGHRELPDFDSLPEPIKNPEIIDISKYPTDNYETFGIQTKRGCLFECSYCNYPFLNGKKLRLRRPESIVDEVESMIKNYKIKCFTFVDNIFNVPVLHAKAICQEILSRNINIEWGAWFGLKNFSEELLDIVVEAGCRHIDFSPDAATNEGLKYLRKGIEVKSIESSLELIKRKKNVFVCYNFFCVYPKQNFKGALMTLYFVQRIIFYLFGRARVSIGWIRIEPNTKVYQTAIEEKLITRSTPLLVKDKRSLEKLFYTKSSLRYIDITFCLLLNAADYLLKPVFKTLFKLFRKNYPFFYD